MVRPDIDKIVNKIPAELRDQIELPDLDNPEEVHLLMAEVRAMLLPMLLTDREGR